MKSESGRIDGDLVTLNLRVLSKLVRLWELLFFRNSSKLFQAGNYTIYSEKAKQYNLPIYFTIDLFMENLKSHSLKSKSCSEKKIIKRC